jgi:hypothetical protein
MNKLFCGLRNHNLIKLLTRFFETDPYFGGAVLGLVTTIPYLILDYLYSLFLNVNPIPIYSATLVVSHTAIPWDYLLGIIADLAAGSFLGFIIIVVLERTSYGFLSAKCLGIGVVLWILHVSIIPKLWEPELLKLMNRPTVYMALFNHMIWGLGYGITLRIMQKTISLNS